MQGPHLSMAYLVLSLIHTVQGIDVLCPLYFGRRSHRALVP